MAITATHLGRGQTAAGGAITMAATLSSLSPSDGHLLVACLALNAVSSGGTNIETTFAMSDTIGDSGGGSWTRRAACTAGGRTGAQYFERVEIWTRQLGTGAGTSKAVTATTTATNEQTTSTDGWMWLDVFELSGHNASPIGLSTGNTSRQAPGGTTITLSLGDTPAADSWCVSVLHGDNTVARVLATVPSSWTQQQGDNPTWGATSQSAAKNGSGTASPQWTGLTTASGYLGCALEIKAAGATAPGQVTGVRTSSRSTSSIALTWTAPSDGGSSITDYEVRLNAGSWMSLATTSTSATLTGLSTDTSYAIEIRAVNAVGDGTASASQSCQTWPSAATGLWPTATSGRLVLDQHGDPWMGKVFDCGASMLGQLTDNEIDDYLRTIAGLGWQGFWVNLWEYEFADNAPNDIWGNAPFTGTPWQSTPASGQMDRAERMLDLAEQLGLTALLFVNYLGYNGATPAEGWATEIAAASNAQMEAVGGAVGTMLAAHPNVIIVAGADRNPDSTLLDRTDHYIGAILAETSQLVTTHQARGSDTDDIWSAYTWWDIQAVYDNGTAGTPDWEDGYNAVTGPALYIEGYFENSNSVSALQLRRQLWVPLVEHGVAAMIGSNPRWYFGSSTGAAFADSTSAPFDTWQDSLGSDFAGWSSVAAQFFAGYDPGVLGAIVPGVSLVTTGEGTTTSKAAIGVDTTGGHAIVYFPTSRSVTLDLSVFTPPSLTLTWLDPTSGDVTAIGTYANTSGRSVTYPSSNDDGGSDWVLVIEPVPNVVGHTALVTTIAGTGTVGGQADVTGTPTVVTVVAGTGEVTATRDVTGTGTVVTVVAGEGDVTGAAAVTAAGTVVTAVAGTGDITAQADVTGTGTVVTVVAGTGDASSTPNIAGTGTVVTVVAGTGDVTGTAAVTANPTVVTVVAGTGEVGTAGGVHGAGTIVATVAGTGDVTGQADVEGAPTIVAVAAGVGDTSSTTPVTGTPTIVAVTAAVGTVGAIPQVTGTPTAVAITAGIGDITATASVIATGVIVTVIAGRAARSTVAGRATISWDLPAVAIGWDLPGVSIEWEPT